MTKLRGVDRPNPPIAHVPTPSLCRRKRLPLSIMARDMERRALQSNGGTDSFANRVVQACTRGQFADSATFNSGGRRLFRNERQEVE